MLRANQAERKCLLNYSDSAPATRYTTDPLVSWPTPSSALSRAFRRFRNRGNGLCGGDFLLGFQRGAKLFYQLLRKFMNVLQEFPSSDYVLKAFPRFFIANRCKVVVYF